MRINKYYIAFTFTLFLHLSYSQNKDSLIVARYISETKIALENDSLDKAFKLIQDAFEISVNLKDLSIEGELQILAASLYREKQDNSMALKYYIRALSTYSKLNDKEKQFLINTIIADTYFQNEEYSKASDFFYNALKINPSISNIEETALLLRIGNCHFYNQKYDSALVYFQNSANNCLNNKDTSNLTYANRMIAETYSSLGNFKEAVQIYNINYELFKKNSDIQGILVCKNNMGNIYVRQKMYPEAIEAYSDAIDIYKANQVSKKNMFASTYTNLGICYKNMFDYENSINYLNQANELLTEYGHPQEHAILLKLLVYIYLELDDIYNASVYAEQAVQKAEESGNAKLIMECYMLYSDILKKANDTERAFDYYIKYLGVKDSVQTAEEKRIANLNKEQASLKTTEEKEKLKLKDEELKEMLYVQQELEIQKLKIETEKNKKDQELLRQQAELARVNQQRTEQALILAKKESEAILKQKEIEELEQNKLLQEAQLKEKEAHEKQQETELAKQKAEIEKQETKERGMKRLLFLGIIIIGLSIYVIISTRKKNTILVSQQIEITEKNEELQQQSEELMTQKEHLEIANTNILQKNEEILAQKEELESANEHISFKNKQITDSIRYAKNIQNAVLPSEYLFEAVFNDYFLLYKPKDIVSGDFYWIKQIENKTVIAVADCTGHGVPGAFMSMLGISLLNELVAIKTFVNPAKTLELLRDKVKISLRQNEKDSEQRSGMDMVLISIDFEKMMIQFAGAHNPMLMIRNKQYELIKGDRMPIGIHSKEEDFINKEIPIKKGDVFYLYSDGYQDQFGGPKGTKFFSSRLREFLLELHEKDMKTQKEILNNSFTEWQTQVSHKGQKFEQIDDILVLGFRI